MAAFTEAREALIFMDTRLLLRLGREHPVRRAFAEAVDAIGKAGSDVLTLVTFDRPPPDDSLERAINERQALHDANQRFLDAASDFVSAPIRSLDPTP
jgi:hypothetical protein